MNAAARRPFRGGLLFAVALACLVAGLALHPPESYDTQVAFETVAHNEAAWRASHALLAGFPFAFAVGAALLLPATTGARRFAWALVACGGLLATAGFVIEATASPTVAVAGDLTAYRAFSGLSAGLLIGASPLMLGIALHAALDARAATGAVGRWVDGIVAALTVVGAVGVVGDSLRVAAVGQLLPLILAGAAYAAVWGIRAAMGRTGPSSERSSWGGASADP